MNGVAVFAWFVRCPHWGGLGRELRHVAASARERCTISWLIPQAVEAGIPGFAL
jgi:hypothetical protein